MLVTGMHAHERLRKYRKCPGHDMQCLVFGSDAEQWSVCWHPSL